MYKHKHIPYIHPVDIFMSETLSTQSVYCYKVKDFLHAGDIYKNKFSKSDGIIML